MQARIYKPTKTAMQSGTRKESWVFEYIAPTKGRYIEPLMGRIGSKNMLSEIKIEFGSKEEAVRFAETNNYNYELILPKERKMIKKSYADNFK